MRVTCGGRCDALCRAVPCCAELSKPAGAKPRLDSRTLMLSRLPAEAEGPLPRWPFEEEVAALPALAVVSQVA